jgi:molybdate-binding protein
MLPTSWCPLNGGCVVTGFHVPMGDFEIAAWAKYLKWFKPRKYRLIHLAERQQGIFIQAGNTRLIRFLPART